MSLRISNLRLGVDTDEMELPARAASALRLVPSEILSWRILRKSLDARDADDLAFVYALEVSLGNEHEILKRPDRRDSIQVAEYHEDTFMMPSVGTAILRERPVIIGSGPGGLAAGYFLAEQGYLPIVLERGGPVHERVEDVRAFDRGGVHNPESNYLFGEGGAGTFSDGKLTCRMSGPDVRRILQLYAACKGKPSILYDQRPHLGSNRLPAVVKAQRQRILACGGEIRFHCRVIDFDIVDAKIRGVMTTSGYIPASAVVLATGHSARDIYEMLHQRGVPMVHKPFQIGVRIEHPQENTNRHCYGARRLEERLGSASFNLVQNTTAGLDLFSFCMCAGGYVMPSISEPEHFCTNGMSLSKRDSPYANSGLVVTLGSEHFGSDHPLAGMRLQRHYESLAFERGKRRYMCPIQWANDFLAQKGSQGKLPSSYPRETIATDVAALIPPIIARSLQQALPAIDRRWRGWFLRDATLVAPESRGSAPVRIPRNANSRDVDSLSGLYPVGEGAGYAGGIISAAVDGLRTAKAIIAKYAPLKR